MPTRMVACVQVPSLGVKLYPMPEAAWYYALNDQRQGPVAFEHLRQLAITGQITPTDLVWCEGMADWQPAHTIAGLGPPPAAAPPTPPPNYNYYGVQPMAYASAMPTGQSYNGMAIAGFVLSLTIPLLGVIFSWIALAGIKRTGNEEGKGLATAGLIISIAILSLGCLWFIGAMTCIGVGSRY
jgi:hypothetical protein